MAIFVAHLPDADKLCSIWKTCGVISERMEYLTQWAVSSGSEVAFLCIHERFCS